MNPDVQGDLERFVARLVQDGDPLSIAAKDQMTCLRTRAALAATQIPVAVSGGELMLGTWQGIYLWEHCTRAHQREIVVHIVGE